MTTAHACYDIPSSPLHNDSVDKSEFKGRIMSRVHYAKSPENATPGNIWELLNYYKVSICTALISLMALALLILLMIYVILDTEGGYPKTHIGRRNVEGLPVNEKLLAGERLNDDETFGMRLINPWNQVIQERQLIRKKREGETDTAFSCASREEDCRTLLDKVAKTDEDKMQLKNVLKKLERMDDTMLQRLNQCLQCHEQAHQELDSEETGYQASQPREMNVEENLEDVIPFIHSVGSEENTPETHEKPPDVNKEEATDENIGNHDTAQERNDSSPDKTDEENHQEVIETTHSDFTTSVTITATVADSDASEGQWDVTKISNSSQERGQPGREGDLKVHGPPETAQSRQSSLSDSSGQMTSDQYSSQLMQFTSPTGESINTGQQLLYNPSITFPICFYGPLSSGPGEAKSAYGQMPFSAVPQTLGQSPVIKPTFFQGQDNYQYPSNPGSFILQIPQIGPTGPGNYPQAYGGKQVQPSTGRSSQSLYCTYVSPANVPTIPLLPVYQNNPRLSDENVQRVVDSNPWEFSNSAFQNMRFSSNLQNCPPNHYRCADNSRCVEASQWCDRKVDCRDASDEIKCSCRDRIGKERLCDGYFDCPNGEDELGCFGCDRDSFRCDESARSYRRENCISITQRCDNIKHCKNGKDEMECNTLSYNTEMTNIFNVGYTTGYLHKNWKGQWYPVCSLNQSWTEDACSSEIGEESKKFIVVQRMSVPQNAYVKSYIIGDKNGNPMIVDQCDKIVHVTCPKIPCGKRMTYPLDDFRFSTGLRKREKHVRDFAKEHFSNYENTTVGVVGGRASLPKAWPFLIAIYKDGVFHCGGTIIDKEWILTAAHCLHNPFNHYFEVRAGILRRQSFSPMAQIRKAKTVFIHPEFDKNLQINDTALIQLDEPLQFNRWVRPACLPTDEYWDNNPKPNTMCIAIGWGATAEHGNDPDQLQEVEVPILQECKHPTDRNDATICAGFAEGGRDACQGDSGGPLMCKKYVGNQWYVIGIVSHGDGCARPNEPGIYTRVRRFKDWIEQMITNPVNRDAKQPAQTCRGFLCKGQYSVCLPSYRRCDQFIDCLDGDDEMNCPTLPNSDSSGFRDASNNIDEVTENNHETKPPENEDKTESTIDSNTIPFTNEETYNGTSESDSTTTGTTLSGSTSMPNNSDLTSVETATRQNYATPRTRFTCKNLIQNILLWERCDQKFDCEDGTDEEDCTCKDILQKYHPNLICDGHIDCKDLSDEEQCEHCPADMYKCYKSGNCIPSNKKCNRQYDCKYREDETDCYILSDGSKVNLDLHGRPHLRLDGILTQNRNGNWHPVCIRDRAQKNNTIQNMMGRHMCYYFGFNGPDSVEQVPVLNDTLLTKASSKINVISHEYSTFYYKPDANTSDVCNGLHISCKPVLSISVNDLFAPQTRSKNKTYLFPWRAAIFVEGLYRCSAIILDKQWLLSTTHCSRDLNLKTNYTTALLGLSSGYLYVDGPHQEITPVDSIRYVKNSNATLFHLKYPLNITRYVQPIFLEKKIYPATANDTCIAMGEDKDYQNKILLLQSELNTCPKCTRCFSADEIEICDNTTSAWSGTVVCRGFGGWYPSAVFHKQPPCSFNTLQSLVSIDYINAYISKAIENYYPVTEPPCNGFRCSLGNCIPSNLICDGIQHCRDGADEHPMNCKKQQARCKADSAECNSPECSKSELRCASGQCVPKSAFCDGNIDCFDSSDEPENCTCAEYLNLTSPSRICDGKRDCYDKTDENPFLCKCSDSSFVCSDNNGEELCIPQEYVCDEHKDCADGKDEKTCTMIDTKHNMGEVISRSFGVWHSECFAQPVTMQDAMRICQSAGYKFGYLQDEPKSNYRSPVIPQIDDFYMIMLNKKSWVILRDDKPRVALVKPKEKCHRAFIKCLST